MTVTAWVWTAAQSDADLSLFSPRLDPWIWILQVLGTVVLVGAAIVGVWNAKLTWMRKGSRLAKLWSLVLAVACLAVLWVGVVFKLIGFSASY